MLSAVRQNPAEIIHSLSVIKTLSEAQIQGLYRACAEIIFSAYKIPDREAEPQLREILVSSGARSGGSIEATAVETRKFASFRADDKPKEAFRSLVHWCAMMQQLVAQSKRSLDVVQVIKCDVQRTGLFDIHYRSLDILMRRAVLAGTLESALSLCVDLPLQLEHSFFLSAALEDTIHSNCPLSIANDVHLIIRFVFSYG